MVKKYESIWPYLYEQLEQRVVWWLKVTSAFNRNLAPKNGSMPYWSMVGKRCWTYYIHCQITWKTKPSSLFKEKFRNEVCSNEFSTKCFEQVLMERHGSKKALTLVFTEKDIKKYRSQMGMDMNQLTIWKSNGLGRWIVNEPFTHKENQWAWKVNQSDWFTRKFDAFGRWRQMNTMIHKEIQRAWKVNMSNLYSRNLICIFIAFHVELVKSFTQPTHHIFFLIGNFY